VSWAKATLAKQHTSTSRVKLSAVTGLFIFD
jgi:hypothetical protein